jgi:hypothetical protein
VAYLLQEQKRLTDLAIARDYGTFVSLQQVKRDPTLEFGEPYESDEDKFRNLVRMYRSQGLSEEEIQARVGGEQW